MAVARSTKVHSISANKFYRIKTRSVVHQRSVHRIRSEATVRPLAPHPHTTYRETTLISSILPKRLQWLASKLRLPSRPMRKLSRRRLSYVFTSATLDSKSVKIIRFSSFHQSTSTNLHPTKSTSKSFYSPFTTGLVYFSGFANFVTFSWPGLGSTISFFSSSV